MVKAMRGQGLHGGVLRGSVLSSLARYGVMRRCLAWLGIVRSCPVRFRDVMRGLSWRGRVLHGRAWHGEVLYSKVRHGLIEVLRGLALYSTVLSCPVRLCKASGKVFRGLVSHGGAGSCPAGSGGVWLCKVRRFMVRSGCVGWATVERGFVLQGTALFWQGGVEQSEVRYGKLSLWPGEVRLCVVGFVGALYSRVRSYCGVVWNVEALHSIVKFCPVKHCMVKFAKALRGGVLHGLDWRGSVGRCLVRLAKVIFRHGTVGSCFVRLCAVGQALVRHHYGLVWPCEVGRCIARFASVFMGMEV